MDSVYGARATVDSIELMQQRLPSTSRLQVSLACRQAAERQRAQWELEDFNNWEQLSNRACSAKLGWVEYHPGTCTAGGPPPICPRQDHWYRDFSAGEARWKQENAAVRQQREDALVASACTCWTAEVETNAKSVQTTTTPHTAGGTSSFVVPCSGSCPIPGMTCKEGVCQPQTTLGAAVSSLGERGATFAADKAIEYLSEPMTQAIEGALLKVMSAMKVNLLTSIVTELFQTTDGGLWQTTYEKRVTELNSRMAELRSELRLQLRLRGTEQYLTTKRVEQLREEVRPVLADMNLALSGIMREHTLGRYACYPVVELQNSFVNLAVVRLLNAPLAPQRQQ